MPSNDNPTQPELRGGAARLLRALRAFAVQDAHHFSAMILSILRSGSAAPQRSWSPHVNAFRNVFPIFILRSLPTGTVSVPVIAAGVSSFIVISRTFGTTF